MGSVLASVVDGNSNRPGKLDSQAGSLDFVQSEASAESEPVIISDGGAADGGPEAVKGPWSDGSSLSSPSLKSSLLPGGLVEPGPDISLPVFPEVDVGEDVVVLDHK